MQVELDTVNLFDRTFQRWLKRHRVRVKVIAECGPGSGWAAVRYTGPKAAVERMLREWFDIGPEGTEE